MPQSSEPPKSKSYFLFLPQSQLYIAPCTIANLGGLDSWTGGGLLFQRQPTCSRRPTPSGMLSADRGPQRWGTSTQPSQAPHTLAPPPLRCARLENWQDAAETHFLNCQNYYEFTGRVERITVCICGESDSRTGVKLVGK